MPALVVIITLPSVLLVCESVKITESPKSITLMGLSSVLSRSRKFSGLRSRWQMP